MLAKSKGTIRVTCSGAAELPLSYILPLQGELKVLTDEAYKKLKASIIKYGFSFPFFVWENHEDAQIYCTDGHQRLETLTRMRDEGYVIPQLPVAFIEAENMDEAKAKILAASSQYGKFTEQGVKGFLDSFDIKTDELFETIDIPFMNMDLSTASILEPDLDPQTVDVSSHKREIHKDPPQENEEYQTCITCGTKVLQKKTKTKIRKKK